MNARQWLGWLPVLVLSAWPVACAVQEHSFSDVPPDEHGGNAGAPAGAGDAGRASGTAGTAHGGRAGNGSTSGGDAGDVGEAGTGASGGDAGDAGAGGTGPIFGGAGPTAGAGGSMPVAPTIVMVTPAPDATGVRVDQSIVVQFSVPMSKTVTQAAFDPMTLGAGMFSWSTDAKTMTYKPSQPLAYATGNSPATTTAKLYTYKIDAAAESADGLPLAAAKTYGFSTARQIATDLHPSDTWNVNSANTTSPCQPGDCDGVDVGDNAANVSSRGVLHYDLSGLPSGAFVQDVRMNVNIYFANGSIATLGTLYIGKATGIVYAATQTTAFFSFTILAKNMSEDTYADAGAALLNNGSFGATDLYLSLLWSVPTNNNAAYDDIFIDKGDLAMHYLIP